MGKKWAGGREAGRIQGKGVLLGGSTGMARGIEGEVGWGSWHSLGLLPQFPVPGPEKGRTRKTTGASSGATKPDGLQGEKEEGSLGQ